MRSLALATLLTLAAACGKASDAGPCTDQCAPVAGNWTFTDDSHGSCQGWQLSSYTASAVLQQDKSKLTLDFGNDTLTATLDKTGGADFHGEFDASNNGSTAHVVLDVTGSFTSDGASYSGSANWTVTPATTGADCTFSGNFTGTKQ